MAAEAPNTNLKCGCFEGPVEKWPNATNAKTLALPSNTVTVQQSLEAL